MKKLLFSGFILLILIFSSCSNTEQDNEDSVIQHVAERDVAVDIATDSQSESIQFSLDPFLKEGTEKHNIAVIIYGVWEDFPDYSEVFSGIINGLIELGWVKSIEKSSFYYDNEMKKIKEVLDIILLFENNEYSDYLNFSKDFYFDLEWDTETAVSDLFRSMVSETGETDLIIALGTGAGQVLSAMEDLKVPVIADSISDPLGSDIIESYTNSGNEYLTVRVDPDRYKRQIRMFHDVVGFENLGIIYEDSDDGRAYGAISDIELIAEEQGFNIVHNTNVLPVDAGEEACAAQYLVAVEEVCRKADAIYFGIVNGLSSPNLPFIMNIVNSFKLPSFAMKGSVYVKQGVLFGVSESEELATGIHNAKNIATMLRGKIPQTIPQIFEHVPHIAINLTEAELIDYNIPIDIIASSDEIYKDIITGNDND